MKFQGVGMILVRKINQQEIVVNCELIQTIEFTPHAVLTLINGEKILIAETAAEIIRKVIEYKRAINNRGLEIRSGTAKIEAI
jgi:flagellar protein FlbD